MPHRAFVFPAPLCALVSLALLACAPAGGLLDGSGYLGIPDNERYPPSHHKPFQKVAAKTYYAILPVEVTTRQQFEQNRAAGAALYVVRSQDGFTYYSVETSGDFLQFPGGHAWVTILQRYKCKAD